MPSTLKIKTLKCKNVKQIFLLQHVGRSTGRVHPSQQVSHAYAYGGLRQFHSDITPRIPELVPGTTHVARSQFLQRIILG